MALRGPERAWPGQPSFFAGLAPMHIALNWIQLRDKVHALLQSVTAAFVHPIGCAALWNRFAIPEWHR
jgi:hypothetical protein